MKPCGEFVIIKLKNGNPSVEGSAYSDLHKKRNLILCKMEMNLT